MERQAQASIEINLVRVDQEQVVDPDEDSRPSGHEAPKPGLCIGRLAYRRVVHRAEDPQTYAHELLHLFGLIDRYYYSAIGDTTIAVRTERLSDNLTESGHERETTTGRPDPLGLEQGVILDEDLMHVLDGTGVFEAELARGYALPMIEAIHGRRLSPREIQAEIDINAARKSSCVDRDGLCLLPGRGMRRTALTRAGARRRPRVAAARGWDST